MTKTNGEIDGIILDKEECNNIHLWLEDYFETLKSYKTDDVPSGLKSALEERIRKVKEYCDNFLFFRD